MNVRTVHSAMAEVLQPGRFFVAAPRRLRVVQADGETLPWEIYRGHLLDPAQTRQTATFAAWHVFLDEHDVHAPAPLVSLLYDATAQRVSVTRQILVHGFEAYEEWPGVILSRPVEKWTRELVATVDAVRLAPESLSAELATSLFLAIIGTSRLPITSLESPLPSFSLGQWAYLPGMRARQDGPWTDAVAMFRQAWQDELPFLEQAKALEMALRATDADQSARLVDGAEACVAASAAGRERIVDVLRTLVNHVALSPYTGFGDRLIGLLSALGNGTAVGAIAMLDLVAGVLVQLCRHLTAFDLALFHNYGANYPDALLLDGLLKAYLQMIERNPQAVARGEDDPPDAARTRRIRRRALRQAALVRRHYEGHRVPDAPTSMGEHARVLPAPFARVPQEQITDAARRRKTLFDGDPTEFLLTPIGRELLQASLDDLRRPIELAELGTAYFLDRPLGIGKLPGEVDRTPLVSYVAYSATIARRRLQALHAAGRISAEELASLADELAAHPAVGVRASTLSLLERPGVVSLADALKVAPDFVLRRTTRRSVAELCELYDFAPLAELWQQPLDAFVQSFWVIVHHFEQGDATSVRSLCIHDAGGQLRAELSLARDRDAHVRYVERGGLELVERLEVVRAWHQNGGSLVPCDLGERPICISLRKAALPAN